MVTPCYRFIRHVITLFAGFVVLSVVHAQEAKLTQDPTIQDMVQPAFPSSLVERGITRGSVSLLVEVDSNGEVQDILITEAKYQAFVDACLSTLEHWKFSPRVVDGQSYGYVKPIKLEFDVGNTITNVSVGGFTNYVSGNIGGKRSDYSKNAVRMKDLDRIPKPLLMAPPEYSDDMKKVGVEGSAIVEFYIDDTGTVRMPYLVKGTGTQLDLLALETVRKWKFEPPMSKGKPVLVKAMQTFTFRNQ